MKATKRSTKHDADRAPNQQESSVVRFIVRIVLLALYGSHYWLMFNVFATCPERDNMFRIYQEYGGRWRFLTAINESAVTLYLITVFINDILPFDFFKAHTKRFCDWAFTAVVWPVTLIVVIFFWSLYLIDRELIFSVRYDVCIPLILNHGWHTLPLIATVAEMVFVCHKFPTNTAAVFTMASTSAGYTSWLLVIYYKTNKWVYPFMKVFTPVTFVIFTTISAVISLGFYFIGKILSRAVWGST